MTTPLDRDQLPDGLSELGSAIAAEGLSVTPHVVGGAAILLTIDSTRRSTVDIDAWVNTPNDFVRSRVFELAATIANRRGWPSEWVNDKAQLFIPEMVSGRLDEWEFVYEIGGFRVVAARPDVLLAMKLLAGRASRDLPDLPALISAAELTTRAEIDELFEDMYPHDEMKRTTRLWLDSFYPHT